MDRASAVRKLGKSCRFLLYGVAFGVLCQVIREMGWTWSKVLGNLLGGSDWCWLVAGVVAAVVGRVALVWRMINTAFFLLSAVPAYYLTRSVWYAIQSTLAPGVSPSAVLHNFFGQAVTVAYWLVAAGLIILPCAVMGWCITQGGWLRVAALAVLGAFVAMREFRMFHYWEQDAVVKWAHMVTAMVALLVPIMVAVVPRFRR